MLRFSPPAWVALQQLGEQAASRLARLDITDPQAFEAMMDARDMAYRKTDKGTYVVHTEGGEMTWSAAVQMGALKYLSARQAMTALTQP